MIKKWQASRRIKLFVGFVERLKQSCSLSIFFELFSLQLKLFNSEQDLIYFTGFSQVKQRDLCLLKKIDFFHIFFIISYKIMLEMNMLTEIK